MISVQHAGVVDKYQFNFERNSVGYTPDGRFVYPHQARFVKQDGHIGVLVEEGTLNLVPSRFVTMNVAHFISYNGGVLSNDNTVLSKYGGPCLKVDAPNRNAGFRLSQPRPAVTVGKTYTLTAEVFGSGIVCLNTFCFDVNGSTTKNVLSDDIVLDGKGWVTLQVTMEAPENSVTADIRVINHGSETGALFYVGALQIEEKPYATTYTQPGTIRSPELLTVPTVGLSPIEGCWRQWVYIDDIVKRQISSATASPRLVDITQADGKSNYISLYHRYNNPVWQLMFGNNVVISNISDNYTPNGWHLFEIAWNNINVKLCIDGINVGIANASLTSNLGNATLGYLGSSENTFANTVHGQVQLLNRYPSDEESLAVYQRGVNSLIWDEHTIGLYTFNGLNQQRTTRSIYI